MQYLLLSILSEIHTKAVFICESELCLLCLTYTIFDFIKDLKAAT